MAELGKSIKYYDDIEVTRYREKFIGKATIFVQEFSPDDKSAALYAQGIAICGPRETFDEKEGDRRAIGRAKWVITRFEKYKYNMTHYMARYDKKRNRKLLTESQLSYAEREQLGLEKIVEEMPVQATPAPTEPIPAPVEPTQAYEAALAPEAVQVPPAPITEPISTPEPAYEPAQAQPAPEPATLPPIVSSPIRMPDCAAFFALGDAQLEKAVAPPSKKKHAKNHGFHEEEFGGQYI